MLLVYHQQRLAATLSFASLHPHTHLQAPAGATHYRMMQLLGLASNYTCHEATGKYHPAAAASSGQTTLTHSPIYSLTAGPQTITLPPSLVPAAQQTLLHCVGIQFFQHINGSDYPLAGGNAGEVVSVL
jgi:hypothetical protein